MSVHQIICPCEGMELLFSSLGFIFHKDVSLNPGLVSDKHISINFKL